MSIKDFQVITKLGEGAYSSVYKVKRIADGVEYALKKVKLMNLSDKEKQNALNEVRILASIRHQNIIGYREAFLDDGSNSLCIVMEFANNGDLFQKIVENQKKGTLFNEGEIWSIFIQVVKGLKALHDLKIFHRDLKSANVFLNKDGTVKLGDMNVSKIAKKGLLYTQTGTPYYASPEVWKDQPYDQKSDIWSLGCVLYEITTLKPPFRAEDMEGLFKKVIRGYYPRIPSNFSQDLNNVIRALLQVAPHLRPSCDKILQLPVIMKKMDDKNLLEVDEEVPFLLNTIRIPKNFHYLTERLPKPNYSPLKVRKVDKQRFLLSLAQSEPDKQSNMNDFGIPINNNSSHHSQSNNELPKLPKINNHGKNSESLSRGVSAKKRQGGGAPAQENRGHPTQTKEHKDHSLLGGKYDEEVSMIKNEQRKLNEKEDKHIAMIQQIYGSKPKNKKAQDVTSTPGKSKSKKANLLELEGEAKPINQKAKKANYHSLDDSYSEYKEGAKLPAIINNKSKVKPLNVEGQRLPQINNIGQEKINQINKAYKPFLPVLDGRENQKSIKNLKTKNPSAKNLSLPPNLDNSGEF